MSTPEPLPHAGGSYQRDPVTGELTPSTPLPAAPIPAPQE